MIETPLWEFASFWPLVKRTLVLSGALVMWLRACRYQLKCASLKASWNGHEFGILWSLSVGVCCWLMAVLQTNVNFKPIRDSHILKPYLIGYIHYVNWPTALKSSQTTPQPHHYWPLEILNCKLSTTQGESCFVNLASTASKVQRLIVWLLRGFKVCNLPGR